MLPDEPTVWATPAGRVVMDLLEWLTNGLGEVLCAGEPTERVRWFVWSAEPSTVPPTSLGDPYIVQHAERIQRIGDPRTGGVRWVMAKVGQAFDDAGTLWGVGAVAESGRVYRMTLGIPAWWPTSDTGAPLPRACTISWTPDAAVARTVFGR